jgi:hypothetical protein
VGADLRVIAPPVDTGTPVSTRIFACPDSLTDLLTDLPRANDAPAGREHRRRVDDNEGGEALGVVVGVHLAHLRRLGPGLGFWLGVGLRVGVRVGVRLRLRLRLRLRARVTLTCLGLGLGLGLG